MSSQIHIIVKGKVQGVYFREFTKRQAISLGLKGTVRNLPDRSVEIFVEGDEDQLTAFKEWCWEGSPYSNVTDVVVSADTSKKDLSTFRVVF